MDARDAEAADNPTFCDQEERRIYTEAMISMIQKCPYAEVSACNRSAWEFVAAYRSRCRRARPKTDDGGPTDSDLRGEVHHG